MVVDESNLEIIIRSLYALDAGYDEKKNKVYNLLESFKKIKLNDDGESLLDSDTGQTITQSRRDEIYDKCIGHVNEILGITI